MNENAASSDHSPASGGRSFALDAYVTALAFDRTAVLAFALGDGTLRLLSSDDETPRIVTAHRGAVLCMVAHPRGGFLSGGDDGKLVHTLSDGTIHVLAEEKHRWIEHVAASNASGAIAWASGKKLVVMPKGESLDTRRFDHGSGIGGIAFDPKGKRVAAAHYNGVSLWWTQSSEQKPLLLEWKGSHIAITWSPTGDYIVTAMQENSLHGFRLSDRSDMRMAGYPARIRSFAWSMKGRFLATGGAESVVAWPFDGKGPMGRNAINAGPEGTLVTAVDAHPVSDFLAAGYADGMVFLMRLGDERFTGTKPASGAPVSALSWDSQGRYLAYGCEDGNAGVFDFGVPTPATRPKTGKRP